MVIAIRHINSTSPGNGRAASVPVGRGSFIVLGSVENDWWRFWLYCHASQAECCISYDFGNEGFLKRECGRPGALNKGQLFSHIRPDQSMDVRNAKLTLEVLVFTLYSQETLIL
jgi:hypothetical protein